MSDARTIRHILAALEIPAMAAVPTLEPLRFSLHVVALTAALCLHGTAAAQGGADSSARSTPGQARDASTPGRAPTTPSTAGRGSDNRSTPGASTDSRSTDGRTGGDARSAARERPDDQRSRTPPK